MPDEFSSESAYQLAATKPLVYLETSFISHIVAKESSDALNAAKQQSSRKWWDAYRDGFVLAASPIAYEECRQGDPAMAERLLIIVRSASLLPTNPAMLEIAKLLLEPTGPLPQKAQVDAIHMASASFYRCDFLLTWNFKHIANAKIKRYIERILQKYGYESPTICTPDELMGEMA